jgi:serine phosphatase RsbU (regulator of sigma subunit)
MEKKQNEIEILEQKNKIEQLLSKRQRAMLIGTAVFGLLILALAGGLYNRIKFVRKTNEKINAQNELITDSISYAQRIQSAILPSRGMLEEVMPEHFVILKPKDIVSGDFYWVKEVEDHLVIVGADCTGHGVPGAFMSMLGITLLNDLIGDRCYDAPSAILEQLRAKVKEMLVQEGEVDEQKDGMDLALAIFNKTTRELHFAGANNPLYLIRNKEIPAEKDLEPYASTENGVYQLYELKADKQPIGVHWEETSFTNRTIKLSERDTFYIFSDGFVDQFGGEHRKKYKSLNFKKLLLSMQDKPMASQQQLIEDAYDSWRGEFEQIDDVSVIGVRI